ncbi:MAG TPA: DUF2490 domain-containing protein [Woeseiaceae bacterium]|nr:DUF2490 domain-containing protein [Woeseiaceae bacterium]
MIQANRRSNFWAAAALAASSLVAMSPANATDDNIGLWAVFTTTDAFSSDNGDSRWSYWFDGQVRLQDIGSGATQFLARPGIGYRPGKNLRLWAGYARVESENASGSRSFENRYWQQLNWTTGSALDGNLTMRARLEEKHLSTGDDVGLVLRFRTQYSRPIGAQGDKNLIVSLEPFYNLNATDWGGKSRLAQNRTLVGMRWTLSDKLRLTTAYMNQFVWRDGAEDASNHVAILNFNVKF